MSSQEQLWAFLNSELGLLVSSFFLVTLAGTFLTTWYKRESKKHEIRFVQLHEERAKAIKTFHDKAIEVRKALVVLKYLRMPIGIAPPEITPEEVNEKVEEFRVLSDEYKIYFRKELCDLIDSISDGYSHIWETMESAIVLGQAHEKLQAPELEAESGDATDYIFYRLDILIESLRQEFRDILGVE